MKAEESQAPDLTSALEEKTYEVLRSLVSNNISSIAKELREEPLGKLGVSIGLALEIGGRMLNVHGKLAYARKFGDEADASGCINDPVRPELPGLEDAPVLPGTLEDRMAAEGQED